MIVGIDGHMIGDKSGGNDSYFSNIIENMVVPEDSKFILFMREGVDSSRVPKQFNIVRFQEKNSFRRNFLELPKLCKKYSIDILHTQYFIPFFRPCSVVCTIHDICFEHYKDIFTTKDNVIYRLLIPYAAKHSDMVFTISEYSRQDIVSHYKCRKEKVVLATCAVSSRFKKLERDELDEQQLRNQYGIGTSKYMLSVGNLQPRKNLTRLIRAFVAMKEEYPGEEKLVIVGKKAWMFDDIIKEAVSNGGDSIIFTDYVSQDDLIRLYNAATGFIYPSLFEGFGLPPLEAMACGVPVAVSNRTSLPEVVGDAGIMFDPEDENEMKKVMHRLFSDENLRKEMTEKGNLQKQKFDWKKSAEIIVDTYKQVYRNSSMG